MSDPESETASIEVDNTGKPNPVVEEFEDRFGEDAAAAGTSDPGKAFRENPPSAEEIKEIEETREERLDPDNRPDNAEVDNTGRTFDAETGTFVDDAGADD